MLSVHQSSSSNSKSCKKARSKKKTKPIKVVYIGNPIKVKTTASDFMATVQELTGRDSCLGGGVDGDADTGRLSVDAAGLPRVSDQAMKVIIRDDYFVPQQVPDQVLDYHQDSPGKVDETLGYEIDPFNDDCSFNPDQMLESFAGFLPLLSPLC